MDSLIRKSTPVIRLDGAGVGVGGGQTRIQLKKESLMAEHLVRIQVSQVFAGIVPAQADVRRFIQDISIETSNGRRKFLTGYQAYDLGRFTENQPAPVVTLGATSTADFLLNIHHENDAALYDLYAAIDAARLTSFDLVINWNADNANGFIGGTLPAAAAYTVTARSLGYPGLLKDVNGQRRPWIERFEHRSESIVQPNVAGAGTQYEMRLVSGNLTRQIMLHSFDPTTGAYPNQPVDTTINNIRIVLDGDEKFVSTFLENRKLNAGVRAFNVVGCTVIDFGDDEEGWLDLRGVNEPKVQFDVAAGAPAASTVTLAQDYNILMAK